MDILLIYCRGVHGRRRCAATPTRWHLSRLGNRLVMTSICVIAAGAWAAALRRHTESLAEAVATADAAAGSSMRLAAADALEVLLPLSSFLLPPSCFLRPRASPPRQLLPPQRPSSCQLTLKRSRLRAQCVCRGQQRRR